MEECNLFDLEPDAIQETVVLGNCSKCKYGKRLHNYRSDWIYCTITPSSRTQFGYKKVKARFGCSQFEGR